LDLISELIKTIIDNNLEEKEESWIYKYSDILENLVEERGEIRILLTDKYDDEKDI
jgi:hypothetical protein